MKKNALLLLSLITTLSVSAQEVVSTQGDSYSNPSGSYRLYDRRSVINTGTDGSQ